MLIAVGRPIGLPSPPGSYYLGSSTADDDRVARRRATHGRRSMPRNDPPTPAARSSSLLRHRAIPEITVPTPQYGHSMRAKQEVTGPHRSVGLTLFQISNPWTVQDGEDYGPILGYGRRAGGYFAAKQHCAWPPFNLERREKARPKPATPSCSQSNGYYQKHPGR
jgi:hypothetical protein